jgi:D-alanyl-D-alanine dipeptidase
MPTGYDYFSEKAHRDYDGASTEEKRNRGILESAMVAEGFEPLPTEWWHFDGPGWRNYPLSDEPLEPAAKKPRSKKE